MAQSKSTKKNAPKAAAKSIAPAGAKSGAKFSAEELAAMKEYVQELKSAGRGGKGNGESEVLAKLAAMSPADRVLGERLHAIIKSAAPSLSPKTWYGMPAYAKADGQLICFFQSAEKFKTRYATLGFSDKAKLDDGNMWPSAFALKELTPAEEIRIRALVQKALG